MNEVAKKSLQAALIALVLLGCNPDGEATLSVNNPYIIDELAIRLKRDGIPHQVEGLSIRYPAKHRDMVKVVFDTVKREELLGQNIEWPCVPMKEQFKKLLDEKDIRYRELDSAKGIRWYPPNQDVASTLHAETWTAYSKSPDFSTDSGCFTVKSEQK